MKIARINQNLFELPFLVVYFSTYTYPPYSKFLTYAKSALLLIRPTAISNLRQLYILVLFKG